MPIAKHLRHLYAGEDWQAARMRIFARAGGKFDGDGKYLGEAHCEQCGAMDRTSYFNPQTGRLVLVQLGVAHVDHHDLARFFDDENLRCLDRRCHLIFDKSQHHTTRATRKDSARPLLVIEEAQAS